MVAGHPEDVFEVALGDFKRFVERFERFANYARDGQLSHMELGVKRGCAPSPARIRPSSAPLGCSLSHSSLLLLKDRWMSAIAHSLLDMDAAVAADGWSSGRYHQGR